MPERRVPDVVTNGDSLYQFEVKPQRLTYLARDTRHQVHVRGATRYVVVFVKRKDLRLVRTSVKKLAVDYAVGVHGELRAQRIAVRAFVQPHGLTVARGVLGIQAFGRRRVLS